MESKTPQKDKRRTFTVRLPVRIAESLNRKREEVSLPSESAAIIEAIEDWIGIESSPLIGNAYAGEPCLAPEKEVPRIICNLFEGGDRYGYFHITGDSMDKVVPSGSYVHVKLKEMPTSGKYVAATIESDVGKEPIFKKYKIRDGNIFLESESTNPHHKTIAVVEDIPEKKNSKYQYVLASDIQIEGIWTSGLIMPPPRRIT